MILSLISKAFPFLSTWRVSLVHPSTNETSELARPAATVQVYGEPCTGLRSWAPWAVVNSVQMCSEKDPCSLGVKLTSCSQGFSGSTGAIIYFNDWSTSLYDLL